MLLSQNQRFNESILALNACRLQPCGYAAESEISEPTPNESQENFCNTKTSEPTGLEPTIVLNPSARICARVIPFLLAL
jgi:hypothetical protein